MIQFHTTGSARKLAYVQVSGQGLGVVFLGGFRSDMTGTKAAHLADWAAQNGRPFLRFDYSGHGQSSGRFEDGMISEWSADALDIITHRTSGAQILVGSSMGGWISLLIARAMPQKVAAMALIAAAPDFTEDSMWAGFTNAQKGELAKTGAVQIPSEYGAPYIITQKLIDDGCKNLVLRTPLDLPMPVRLLQGTADDDVPISASLRLLSHAHGSDIRLTLVKDADHRFSSGSCLDLITQTLSDLPR